MGCDSVEFTYSDFGYNPCDFDLVFLFHILGRDRVETKNRQSRGEIEKLRYLANLVEAEFERGFRIFH